MSARSLTWLSAGLLALLGAWLIASAGGSSNLDPGEPSGTRGGEAPPQRGVDALTVRERDARLVVQLAGTLEAVRRVTVGAEVAGRVIEVLAEEHRPVEAGALLVRLDPALDEATVRRARASVLRAAAGEGLARSELERQTDLSKSGVGSPAEFDRVESEARGANAQLAEAEAALVEAETRLAKTRIAAPFAGVVAALDLEPGAYLRPGDPVADVVDLSELEIELALSDREVIALHSGDPVAVTVDAYPGERFAGRIHAVGRAPHPRTLKYPVPVRVPNADGRLLPGMLVSVQLALGESERQLRIPRRAVQREFDLSYVFALEADGGPDIAVVRRRRVEVRPVAFRPDWLEVVAGLEPGERIAVSDVAALRDDERVRTTPVSVPAVLATGPGS